MSQTPETDDVIAKIAAMSLPDQVAQLSAHGRVLERLRQSLGQQLTEEREDNTDTQQKWNEALNAGLKVVGQRDTLRALLEQMLNVAENADETGYVTDCGFIDLDKLHELVRAELKS